MTWHPSGKFFTPTQEILDPPLASLCKTVRVEDSFDSVSATRTRSRSLPPIPSIPPWINKLSPLINETNKN